MNVSVGGAILFVDDNPYTVKCAVSYFRSRGVNALCATSGEEAIRMIRESRIVLMITDLHMPGMDGFELAGEARKIAPHIIVFMVTGALSPGVVLRAREIGIARVFGKPFRLEEVFAAAAAEARFEAPA
jgi:CheY-like chemotaxis protein